jgi:hypothetical protein
MAVSYRTKEQFTQEQMTIKTRKVHGLSPEERQWMVLEQITQSFLTAAYLLVIKQLVPAETSVWCIADVTDCVFASSTLRFFWLLSVSSESNGAEL